jgi:hypothetical protein
MATTSDNIEPPSQKDTRQLLEENQQLLRLILSNTEKTRKYILWGRILSVIYVLIIITPIILAAIYLPPMLKSFVQPYQDLLSGPTNQGSANKGMINEVQQFLNEYGQ